MDEANVIEQERHSRLNQARNAMKLAKDVAGASRGDPRAILSLGKKLSKNWPILMTAVFFDLLGLIPFIGIVFNFCFGGILFFYFGKKKSSQAAKILGIVFPIVLGSALDFFLSVIPVNTMATLIRIAFKEIG